MLCFVLNSESSTQMLTYCKVLGLPFPSGTISAREDNLIVQVVCCLNAFNILQATKALFVARSCAGCCISSHFIDHTTINRVLKPVCCLRSCFEYHVSEATLSWTCRRAVIVKHIPYYQSERAFSKFYTMKVVVDL